MSINEQQRTRNMYAPEAHKSITSPKRRASFAHELMLAEFGKLGHLHDAQWADHVDIDPGGLAEKRWRTIWREVSS